MIIEWYGEPGASVYAVLRTGAYVFNAATTALETLSAPADNEAFAIPLGEDGYVSGKYSADIPNGSTGQYVCEYWQQNGPNPNRSADTRLGAAVFFWDGVQEWSTESLASLDAGTTTINNSGNVAAEDVAEIERMVRELYNRRQLRK